MTKHLVSTFLFVLLLVPYAFAQKTYPSTLTVAQDGSGDYKTIQEAVNSVRDLGEERVRIQIKKGTYNEKIVIPSWKTNISLIGESPEATIITGDDYSGKPVAGGKDAFGLEKFSTFTSYTVLVQGNGVTLENLTIQNTAGRVGQAVALHVEGDRFIARNCHILGNQDTLYTASANSRQYYENCFIEGTTDFIFGEATCVFKDCTIKSLSNSYITASSQRQFQKFGYVFIDCKLIAAPEVDKVFLGRPWRPHAKTVFIRTEMGPQIVAEGWHHWPGDKMFPDKEKTAYYAEYQSKGKGANPAKRVAWSKQLTKKEAEQYTLENIFAGDDKWLPAEAKIN
ncbi:pectinesterase family protein [Botryobacter ruber]|uniref:pectinesterase family protein n=1 Tax=Botryobacter ruber TaxID=2171629 RepID=UPI000E0A56B1|nr:pectinesterase family protein [Botryobacter ruber]